MVCPILCPECGEGLAEVFPFYEKIKQGYCEHLLDQKKIDIDIDKVDLKTDFIKNFGFIFDAIGLNNICCRMHLLATLDFDSIYF